MSSHNTLWSGLIDGIPLIKWAVIGGAGFYLLTLLMTLIFVISALLRLVRRCVFGTGKRPKS